MFDGGNQVNNLFDYATSELSQDAFICWLMSYARHDARQVTDNDKALRNCALAFIKEFVPPLAKLPDAEIFVTNIQKQHLKIDVLLTVNEKYQIIIEDKTSTREHSHQLEKYINDLTAELSEKTKITKESAHNNIYGIYYKTGFQSNYYDVKKANYNIFDRQRILKILNDHKTAITSDIFLNYLEYYNDFETQAQKYQSLPFNKWDWRMLEYFYNDLKATLEKHNETLGGYCDYGYVANPSGGFTGLWLFPKDILNFNEVKYSPYLQLEPGGEKINICFKLAIENDVPNFKPRQLKDKIAFTDDWQYALEKFGLFRPKRLAPGKTMTVGLAWKEAQCDISADEITEKLKKLLQNFGIIINYCKSRTENIIVK
jgi:hypothetical protein